MIHFSRVAGYGMVALCLTFQAAGQRVRKTRPLAVIPFRMEGSQLLFPVTIGGSADTLHFLFDTGCEVNVLSVQAAIRLGLKDQGNGGLSGWRKGMAMMPRTQATGITIGGLSVPYPSFYLQDFGGARMGNIPIDGVMGYDLLKRYVVEINFQKREMTLYKSGLFHDPPGAERLKLTLNYRTPVIEAAVGTGGGHMLQGAYHVVTGGDFGLLLNGKYVEKYGLDSALHPSGPVKRPDLLRPVTYTKGTASVFTIGHHRLEQVGVLYSPQVNDAGHDREIAGAIGARVWRQFILYINLPGSALYLLPAQ